MSLYKDASLVMIPSAYKDGKLYSIRPTDGSGDFAFGRGSNLAATRVDVNGLIEKGRENLLLQSNQFDTTWYNSSSTETGGQAGYDGTNDAWLLTKTGANGGIRQNNTTSGVQTFSFYAKANASTWVKVNNLGSSVYHQANFDLSNGVLGTIGNAIDAKIEDVGSGWYRCITTYDTTLVNIDVRVADSDNVVSGTSGSIYIQDAQLEQGLVATDYIETGASTAQAGILEDMPRLDYSGGASCPSLLLEPQRTNSVIDSEYFGGSSWSKAAVNITDNNAISPEGVQNAALITADGTSTQHYILITSSPSAKTISIFAKMGTQRYVQILTSGTANALANYDLQEGVFGNEGSATTADIEDYGNGWYRLILSSSDALTGNFYLNFVNSLAQGRFAATTSSGTIYVYGAQIEASSSYPTSYIPTYGTSQTRSFDFQSVSGLSADVFNNDNLTLFYDFNYNANGREGSTTAYRIFSGSSGLGIKGTSGTARILQIFGSGDFIGSINFNAAEATRIKVALRVTNGTCELFFNGAKDTETIDVSAGAPYNWGTTQVTASSSINTSLNQCVGFPTALTDSECIALTTL